jgi:predicted N-acetyltransferase YhbS
MTNNAPTLLDSAAALSPAVTIRDLAPTDDIAALTHLLHDAYQPLADSGLRFFASYQNERQTRQRLSAGHPLVADLGGEVVGTITVWPPDRKSKSPHYRRPGVFCLGQFAVRPDHQGHGIGRSLLQAAEDRARQLGAKEVALSTAESAAHLIAWYQRHGYHPVESVSWDTTNYQSVILAKPL